MESHATRPAKRVARPIARVLLLSAGVLAGILLCEVALWIAGIPRFYKPHSAPPQFAFLRSSDDGVPVYLNVPGERIRFLYDGNPRGYFGPQNEVDHETNQLGYRGPEFPLRLTSSGAETDKGEGVVRFVFLGDSFTFGEGVRFEDTYPQVSRKLLQQSQGDTGRTFESYDLGVGGYNTHQELYVLRNLGGLALKPDVVVVGYVLNDAEPPLFRFDPMTGEPMRQGRPIEEGLGDAEPPDDLLYSLRTSRLAWKVLQDRRVSERTERYYKSLYDPSGSGWKETRAALRAIVATCRERNIPCYVLIFPVLYRLDADYPFREIHKLVGDEAKSAGAHVIDLLPAFEGRDARELWVHPSDHHPNETAHAIAARALVEAIAADGTVKPATDDSK